MGVLRTASASRRSNAARLIESASRGLLPNPSPAFNKTAPLHRWTPWTTGFSAAFVSACLDHFLEAGRRDRGVVLDPFAGVGTTLVEASRQGRRAVGFEINPYAALSARAKLGAALLDPSRIESALEDYLHHERNRHGPDRKPPRNFHTKAPFFSAAVEDRALVFMDWLGALDERDVTDLFRVAFGAIMVDLSNYVYGPSLCVVPRHRRTHEANFAEVLASKMRSIIGDIETIRSKGPHAAKTALLHLADYLGSDALVEPKSVDLIVTSPPYLNNYDYVRNTRPQLHWLSLADNSEQSAEIQAAQFGGRWQDVRNVARIDLSFLHRGLEDTLEALIESDAKRGLGWANYVASYFNDWLVLLDRFARDLRPGGAAVVVIGNSTILGSDVDVVRIVEEMTGLVQLDLLGREFVRRRVCRRPDKPELTESVVVFRRPQ